MNQLRTYLTLAKGSKCTSIISISNMQEEQLYLTKHSEHRRDYES